MTLIEKIDQERGKATLLERFQAFECDFELIRGIERSWIVEYFYAQKGYDRHICDYSDRIDKGMGTIGDNSRIVLAVNAMSYEVNS